MIEDIMKAAICTKYGPPEVSGQVEAFGKVGIDYWGEN